MLPPGSEFAGYTVGRLLGAGGMGEVYVATHPRLPRSDALKVLAAQLSSDDNFRRRFEREAAVVAGLSHPGIVAIHDRGEFDGRLWIAFELVDGADLTAQLHSHPTGLPTDHVARIVVEVAAALDYAGARGLVHRDVKPANIILDRDGRVRLTDFGIARTVTEVSDLTGTGMTIGTVSYASPEQLSGDPVDARSDQYSLACTAYHLLTGQVPFADPNVVKVITAHLGAPPPQVRAVRGDLSPAVDAVLARAMAKNPADRFGSSVEFASALSSPLSASRAQPTSYGPAHQPTQTAPARPPTGPPPGPYPPSPAPSRRSPRGLVVAGVIGAAILVLVVAVVVAVTLTSSADDRADGASASVSSSAAGMPRRPVSPTLASLATKPGAPRWSIDAARVGLSTTLPVQAVGGDATTVFFTSYQGHSSGGGGQPGKLVAVDAATGATVWPKPAALTEEEGIWGCVFNASRTVLACYANTKVLFVNPTSGAITATYRDRTWRPDSLDAAGDDFVVTGYRGGDTGPYFARGLTAAAQVRWTVTGARAFESFGEQGLLVQDDAGGSTKKFVVYRAGDGQAVYHGTAGEYYKWIVYVGGFAISRGTDTRADFYDVDGSVTASITGWQVFTHSATFDSVGVSLPILAKSGSGGTVSTIGVVDPATGGVAWSVDDVGITDSVTYVSGRGTAVILSSSGSSNTSVQVYDAYTGAGGGSMSISFPALKPVEFLLGVDDRQRLAVTRSETTAAAFDATSGSQLWSMTGPPGAVAVGDGLYLGGTRYV